MALKLLNSYQATYEGGTTAMCDAQTMEEAAKILTDSIEPNVLQKIRSGVKVSVPDPALAFTTEVVDSVAYASGCRAYPEHGGQVKAGDTVFLSAVVAEGYNFTGWYQGETKLSDDAETAVVVESASPVPAVVVYEAHFETI